MTYYINAEVKVVFKEDDVLLPNTLTFIIRKSVEQLSSTEETDLYSYVDTLLNDRIYKYSNVVLTSDKIISITPKIITTSIHNFNENLPVLATAFSRE